MRGVNQAVERLLVDISEFSTGDRGRIRLWANTSAVTQFLPEDLGAFSAEHPQVINGCSDLIVAVFGERGRHARSAVGMGSLPLGISVEIEAIFSVDP